MARRNCRIGIVVALFLVACFAAVGCGRKPRGSAAQPPQPASATPPAPVPVRAARPAPARPEPVKPAPAVEQQPEPARAVEPRPEPQPEPQPEPVQVVETPQPEPVTPEPVQPQDYLAMADEAAGRGDCRTAMQLVRQYRGEMTDNLMLRLREAGLANDCNQPRRAIELLLDYDARTRAMEPVAAVLADAYLLLNRPGQAAMTWELRYIVDQTAWDAAVHAATLWLEAGVYGTAQWWYLQARDAAPDSPQVEMLATVFEDENYPDG